MNFNKFLTATMIGVAIGMLIAPQKGSETRTTLSENFDRIREYINRLLGRANESIDALRASLESELEGLDDSIKGKVLSIFDEAAQKKSVEKQSQLN